MSQVWFVTGCSRGLGREIAQAVLGAGHRLVATARERRDLEFLGSSDRLLTVALDVRDGAAARAAVGQAVSAFGRVDVAVNNAGAIKANAIEDLPEEDFLLLGSDALAVAEAAATQRAEEDARWRDLSLSTDFDAATES
jgi:NAD(P)-dependent dehydrogenase (short-subunit alcohol dehydrogenase family)